MEKKVYAENRRGTFDYEIIERFEAGIALLGGEVKSIQNGRMNISGAFVIFRGGMGADIPAYQPKNMKEGYDPERARPLLLNKKEIVRLREAVEKQKLTLLALSVYNNNPHIKLSLGLGKRRRKSDKREAIKTRETKREMRKVMR
jgi:SsrA-binding protein